jgi:hypothetical protein
MIERSLVNNYRRSWDPEKDAWTKRGDAADFALFLAAELGLSPKAVQIDKDGKHYRVLVPLISAYWCPPDVLAAEVGSRSVDWDDHLSHFKKEVKQWATS